MDRLSEIKAREAAATPGPWCVMSSDDGYDLVLSHPDVNGYLTRSDWEFIEDARADIPWLIEQVERLRTENERLKRER